MQRGSRRQARLPCRASHLQLYDTKLTFFSTWKVTGTSPATEATTTARRASGTGRRAAAAAARRRGAGGAPPKAAAIR